MTFEEILDQALTCCGGGRVTYRTLQQRFQLDEDALSDLGTNSSLPIRRCTTRQGAASSGLAT